jgi:hypothetical protein
MFKILKQMLILILILLHIDEHDFIARFNHGPTVGFEKDVGSRTNLRIVNRLILAGRNARVKALELQKQEQSTMIGYDACAMKFNTTWFNEVRCKFNSFLLLDVVIIFSIIRFFYSVLKLEKINCYTRNRFILMELEVTTICRDSMQ